MRNVVRWQNLQHRGKYVCIIGGLRAFRARWVPSWKWDKWLSKLPPAIGGRTRTSHKFSRRSLIISPLKTETQEVVHSFFTNNLSIQPHLKPCNHAILSQTDVLRRRYSFGRIYKLARRSVCQNNKKVNPIISEYRKRKCKLKLSQQYFCRTKPPPFWRTWINTFYQYLTSKGNQNPELASHSACPKEETLWSNLRNCSQIKLESELNRGVDFSAEETAKAQRKVLCKKLTNAPTGNQSSPCIESRDAKHKAPCTGDCDKCMTRKCKTNRKRKNSTCILNDLLYFLHNPDFRCKTKCDSPETQTPKNSSAENHSVNVSICEDSPRSSTTDKSKCVTKKHSIKVSIRENAARSGKRAKQTSGPPPAPVINIAIYERLGNSVDPKTKLSKPKSANRNCYYKQKYTLEKVRQSKHEKDKPSEWQLEFDNEDLLTCKNVMRRNKSKQTVSCPKSSSRSSKSNTNLGETGNEEIVKIKICAEPSNRASKCDRKRDKVKTDKEEIDDTCSGTSNESCKSAANLCEKRRGKGKNVDICQKPFNRVRNKCDKNQEEMKTDTEEIDDDCPGMSNRSSVVNLSEKKKCKSHYVDVCQKRSKCDRNLMKADKEEIDDDCPEPRHKSSKLDAHLDENHKLEDEDVCPKPSKRLPKCDDVSEMETDKVEKRDICPRTSNRSCEFNKDLSGKRMDAEKNKAVCTVVSVTLPELDNTSQLKCQPCPCESSTVDQMPCVKSTNVEKIRKPTCEEPSKSCPPKCTNMLTTSKHQNRKQLPCLREEACVELKHSPDVDKVCAENDMRRGRNKTLSPKEVPMLTIRLQIPLSMLGIKKP